MKHFNPYILALLLTEGKFSCHKAACKLEDVSHDKLTRYLSGNDKKQAIDIKSLPKGGSLIFDDTSINKTHSKNIEGIRYVWCSSINKAIKGYTLIKIIYVVGNRIYNLADIIWEKDEGTKNEIIREKLIEFKQEGLKPSIVLFDCFYAACKNLNIINDLGWKYLTLCKSNKIFEKKRVEHHKYFGGKSLSGKARGIYHTVQVAKHCKRYIMTNLACNIKSHSGWKIYQKRWIIETIFRDLKSNLHLEECSSRTIKAQTNHIKACIDAFLFLKNKYPDKSVESARQDYLNNIYSVNFNNYNALSCAA